MFGYLLGFAFFFIVRPDTLGWAIAPFGLAVTIWVALKKVHGASLAHYAMIGAVWTLLAVVLDYFLLVKLLHPADGYYKADVYLYYALCFAVPVVVGWWKLRSAGQTIAP